MQSQEDTDVVPTETKDAVVEPTEQMAPTRRTKLLLDMSILIAILVAAGVVRFVPLRDNDTFWHILAGRYLLDGGSFHGPDPFNTLSTQPWVLHEWAPQVVIALAERHGGRTGLLLLGPALVMVLLAVVYVVVRRWVRVVPAIALTGLVFVAVAPNVSLRPQTVGYVVAVLLVSHLFDSARRERTPWWAVPMVWIWANCHGYWSIGAVVILACAAGLALDRRWRLASRFAGVGVLAIASAAVTPVGPALLRVPFEITGYGQFIREWEPPSLLSTDSVGMLALVVPALLIWFRGTRRPSWMSIFVLGIAVVLQLLYLRTGAVAACIAVVAVAETWSWHAPARLEPWRRTEWGAIATALAIGLAVCVAIAPSRTGTIQGKPTGLDAALAALPTNSKMCNDYGLGGWLLWQHPDITVGIDPRTEVYGLDYVAEYMALIGGHNGWERTVDKIGCDYALFGTRAPITELFEKSGWSPLANEGGYTLLRRS